MSVESERTHILQMIEDGLISVEEGIHLIEALETRNAGLPKGEPQPFESSSMNATPDVGGGETRIAAGALQGAFNPAVPGGVPAQPEPEMAPEPEDSPEPQEIAEQRPHPEFTRWRGWWMIPLWVGVAITVISAGLMYLAFQKSGMGFWFACTWFPFALGILLMALAWASQSARWLHVRVHQKPGARPQHISISLPLPIKLTAWFVRTFRGHIPGLEFSGLDELILALGKTNPDTPFYVEVNEGANGERVEVYFG